VRGQLDALMADTGLQVRLDSPVEDLPVGERQRLEILKALYRGARILILDEPTAVLTPQETEQLFVTLRRLRDAGTTLLLITHKLKEIMALCDAVTVMRQGAVVFDGPIAECSLDQLAEAMVGRRVQLGPRRRRGGRVARRAAAAGARTCSWRDALGVPRLAGVSLSLRAGEIVGIAGVSGNGQSELLEMLSGMARPQAGTLAWATGASRPRAGWTRPPRRNLGLAHVPEDRHRCGMVLPFAAWETAVLGYQRSPRFAGAFGWLKRLVMRSATAQMMDAYDVRPRNPALRRSKFSGGNQQKLVLAREALAPEAPPTVLLVGQPTRGVDIGAIEFIHGRLRAMRDAGGAVLVVSSELDEILALADRVLVMDRGRIAGELAIADCTEAALGRLMAGAAARRPRHEDPGHRRQRAHRPRLVVRLARQHQVLGLDRVPSSTAHWVGDLGDAALLRRALQGVDAVVHTAALHAPQVGLVPDAEFQRINVDATRCWPRPPARPAWASSSTPAPPRCTATPPRRPVPPAGSTRRWRRSRAPSTTAASWRPSSCWRAMPMPAPSA
jgi:general nucleoside transport system ATP-binding protein